MKLFLIKCLIAGSIVSVSVFLLLEFMGSYIDPFYNKFTSGRQSSLIIGDSKSFQGLQPAVLDDKLANSFEIPIYNYSFTIKEVVYGDRLLENIKEKLKPDTKNGLFILSVSPWVLTEREGDNIAKNEFSEMELVPCNMENVSMNPNLEYILTNFENLAFKSIFRRNSQTYSDGWMEDKHMAPNIATKKAWEKVQLTNSRNLTKKWRKSTYRLQKLSETIAFLQKHGTVYLIRMPSGASLTDIENKYWNNFDKTISVIAQKNQVPYINFSTHNGKYETYDGVHLNKEVGAIFSSVLSDSIIKYEQVK